MCIRDRVRRVVNNLADGKAKGVDGWSPAELRAPSRSHITGLTDILNNVENNQKWPQGLNPIIALMPKSGAGNEGQLTPIAILPYMQQLLRSRLDTKSHAGAYIKHRSAASQQRNPCWMW
eukprot:5340145-Heterocapsa_arctica.AAC.1